MHRNWIRGVRLPADPDSALLPGVTESELLEWDLLLLPDDEWQVYATPRGLFDVEDGPDSFVEKRADGTLMPKDKDMSNSVLAQKARIRQQIAERKAQQAQQGKQ